MTRRGKLPDHVYQQLETNSQFEFTECDFCYKEVKSTRKSREEDAYICEECYAEEAMELEGLNPLEWEEKGEHPDEFRED